MRKINQLEEKKVLFKVDKYDMMETLGYGQFGIVYKGNLNPSFLLYLQISQS
jgi:hypothetical protein